MNESKIWIRGEIIPQSKAVVQVLSPTAQFGLNVFEGIRGYWNPRQKALYIFRLSDHLDRLMESCRLIGISPPCTQSAIISFLMDVIQANGYQEDIAVRMTVFCDGEGSWHSTEPASMFIAPIAKARTDISKIKGLKACISSWTRINDNVLPPRAKVGANYINSRYAHLQAKKDGYDLPIFLGSDGKVAEGAGACLVLIRKGTLVTPSTTSSILESITRHTIMKLAAELGLEVVERQLDRTELYLADEIFLCGTAAEITPITAVDRFQIGTGEPGPLTMSLLKQYLGLTSGEDERFSEWRTAVRRDGLAI